MTNIINSFTFLCSTNNVKFCCLDCCYKCLSVFSFVLLLSELLKLTGKETALLCVIVRFICIYNRRNRYVAVPAGSGFPAILPFLQPLLPVANRLSPVAPFRIGRISGCRLKKCGGQMITPSVSSISLVSSQSAGSSWVTTGQTDMRDTNALRMNKHVPWL